MGITVSQWQPPLIVGSQEVQLVNSPPPCPIASFVAEFDHSELVLFNLIREFSLVAANKRINQFPFENVLTIKDLLCVVCRRMGQGLEARSENGPDSEARLETWPKWLPTTFNLKTELPKFVSYFQQRGSL